MIIQKKNSQNANSGVGPVGFDLYQGDLIIQWLPFVSGVLWRFLTPLIYCLSTNHNHQYNSLKLGKKRKKKRKRNELFQPTKPNPTSLFIIVYHICMLNLEPEQLMVGNWKTRKQANLELYKDVHGFHHVKCEPLLVSRTFEHPLSHPPSQRLLELSVLGQRFPNPITMAEKDDQEAHENDTDDSENDMNPNEEEDDDSPSSDDMESIIQEDEIMSSVNMKRKKKKALLEFRCRIEDAILGNYILGKPEKNISQEEIANQKAMLRDITLWDVPLLPSKGHQGTDVLLLKFLKARDFKVQEAFEMLSKTIKWRHEYEADKILEEKPDSDIDNVLYLMGRDREGRPLYYNVYGALKDKEFYNKTLGSEDKCKEFLRWRVHCMEKGIKKLDFKNGGVDSIVQITDLKNSPGPAMRELRSVSKRALNLLQNNYPGFIHRNVSSKLYIYVCARARVQLRKINHY